MVTFPVCSTKNSKDRGCLRFVGGWNLNIFVNMLQLGGARGHCLTVSLKKLRPGLGKVINSRTVKLCAVVKYILYMKLFMCVSYLILDI